jgi:O-antigen/teichoic acid export membrane protein
LPLVGMATGSTGTLWLALAALVCWQMQETVRRALMAGLRHSEAIWGDAVSYLGQSCLVWFLVKSRSATLENIFAAMAVSSLAAALLQGLQLGLRRVALAELWRTGRTSWSLGGWTLAASSVSILSSQAFVWAVAGFRGPSEAGALLAVLSVLGVSHPLLFSLGNLIIPAASKGYRAEGAQAAWQTTWKYGRQGAALAAPYLVFLLILPGFALRLLYGAHSPYTELSTPVRWGAVAYAFLFASQVFGCYLGALQRVKRNLLVQILGAGASVLVGLPLAARFGVTGACAGLCAVSLTKVLAGGICSDSLRHGREPQDGNTLPLGKLPFPARFRT